MNLVFAEPPSPETPLRAAIRDAHRLDEAEADSRNLAAAEIPAAARDRIAATARRLVETVRRERLGKGGLDAFLHEYALSSQEGVALMCLAEALLRIPDAETVDRLIREKIGTADWERHLGHSGSLFVNASTWTLMLTGRLLRHPRIEPGVTDLGAVLRRFIARSSEPVCRQAPAARRIRPVIELGDVAGDRAERQLAVAAFVNSGAYRARSARAKNARFTRSATIK